MFRTYHRCQAVCPGGHRCVCNYDVRHTLHICADVACLCHSRARYHGGAHV